MSEYGFEEGIDYISEVEKVHAQKRARTYEQINRICKEEIRNHVNNKNKLTSQIVTLVQSPNLDYPKLDSRNFFVESSYLEFLDQSVILRSDDY
ncbi:antA/AntB antirepressor family protein [Staphylococcus chromogenes]|uniref:antA/AntB antirepressor family protein n=1 Tax=Staphylococcus chromogenes TaxID=46126 RepID=UPI0021753E66|nr:antA/AntB antirepressor family protein [Staphylococcus chromogenes]